MGVTKSGKILAIKMGTWVIGHLILTLSEILHMGAIKIAPSIFTHGLEVGSPKLPFAA